MAGIVRLDKVRSVRCGNIFDVVSDTDTLENGMVCMLGDLKDDEREVYKVVKPETAKIETDEIVLIASPEIMYEEYKRTDNALANFKIEAGTVARAYTLGVSDIFSVSKDMIESQGSIAKNNIVVAKDGSYKLEAKTTGSAGNAKFVAKILGTETIGRGIVINSADKLERTTEFVVLQVIKA